MNPEYKNSYSAFDFKNEESIFSEKGISLERALIIEQAKQDGRITKEDAYGLAILISKGII